MFIRLSEGQLHDVIRESVVKILSEVRYIDTRSQRYGGRIQKNHWTEEYSQEPIKDDDRIRVYHGCDLKTACHIAINGTSGREYHPRTYSYESGMNPLGIFVTTDFEVAKKFGSSNSGMCVIEFTAFGRDLESPVWNGSDSYFCQGSNPMPFNGKAERDAQKERYRQNAMNAKDYSYVDNGKEIVLSKDYIRKSDKPEMADSIFSNAEHQALFMGDLNPNMIKRIWVNMPEDDGYVKTTNAYVPMTVKEFLKKFSDREWQDGYDYKGQPVYYKIRKEKLFNPNEDVSGFNDLVDRVWANKKERKFYKSREQVEKNLKEAGLLQSPPSDFAFDYIKGILWPKQIIELYGKEWFDEHFNRLGQ